MGGNVSQMQIKRQNKIKERDESINQNLLNFEKLNSQLGLDNTRIKQIAETPLKIIIKLLNKGQLNSKQLVVTFCRRTATIGKHLNLITQDNFKQAYQLAIQCDKIRKQSGKKNWQFQNQWNMEKYLPPLFGIPTSIKDIFDQSGKSTTIGLTARANDIKTKDCPILSCFKNSGMIPFVRTNVPQFGMSVETNNFLWGRSKNIWNQNRGVGGSSGGQAGLLAAKCTPIGIGNDVGGSLRIPAQFCGIYSLKVSNNRLIIGSKSCTHFTNAHSGRDTVHTVMGPMGLSVHDLAIWMKMACHQPFYGDNINPYQKLIPFNDQFYLKRQQKPCKIGYFKDFQIIQSTPSSKRALENVITFLKNQGHTLVEIKLPNETEIIKSFLREQGAQGRSRSYKDILQGQQHIPEYGKIMTLSNLSSIPYSIISMYMRHYHPRLGMLMSEARQKTVFEYLTHVGLVSNYKDQVYQYWKENKLDFVICPGYGTAANLHGLSEEIVLAAAYTFVWNLLGYTVGAMPITVVAENEQIYQSKYNDSITEGLKLNARGSVGLPIGIQVVGLPFQEEKVLRLMKIIEEQVKFELNHPYPKLD